MAFARSFTAALALLLALPARALNVAAPSGATCEADLPIPKDSKQREEAKKMLLAILPDFQEGRFDDFSVVNQVQKQTKSTTPGGCQEDAYGELPIPMAQQLFKYLNVQNSDTFADLGSGLGKLPIAAVVLGGAKSALGVELSKKRAEKACIGLKNITAALKKEFPEDHVTGHVTLRQGDLLKEDYHKTTVVYAASICYRRALMEQMGKKLGSEMPTGSRMAVSHNFPYTPPNFSSKGTKKAGVVDVFMYKIGERLLKKKAQQKQTRPQ